MPLSPLAAALLARVPLSARTVLDAACGTGALAAAYRALNPRARLLGIERDPAAAAVAAESLDEVVTADLQTDELPFDLPHGIDCIIYSEILEHLSDPWPLIRRHAGALSADGMMLITTPNLEHWRFTERLLRGNRVAAATGERQPERPRWLDPDTVRDNLLRAGLWLCDVTARADDGEAASRFAASLAPALQALGIDPEDYARRAASSRLIWRAAKEPRARMILSGNMLDPVGGVSDVRVVQPLRAVGTDPMVSATVASQVDVQGKVDDVPRVFVLHRPALLGERGHKVLRELVEGGYLVVTEFDDLPEHFDMMRRGGALSFYGAHALQTSTAAMAGALRQYNPEIAVFPNAISRLPEVRNFADAAVTTLFFGALNRERDWLPLMPAINAAAAMAGDRLRFQVVHDHGFFEALATSHKAFTPTCDYETYLRILGGSEISFMPLGDTPFNRAKSDLKFIETASCRVAALASSVVYGDTIEDGRTGLLFRDPVELHAGLLRLLAMPELARSLADAARQYVADHRMLAYQVAPRIAWYRGLWARRDSLELARRERMRLRRAA